MANMEAMLVGHLRATHYLEAILKKKTWAHGYLFYGPARVGKETFALAFGRSLVCEKARGVLGGCGRCETCQISDLRLANRFFCLRPGAAAVGDQEKEPKKTITIGQVRELRRWLFLASEKIRVVLIDWAEALGGDAANALLKILEEPSGGTVFILISASPEYILPTVLSRVAPIRFGLVADKEMQKIEGATDEAIFLSRGRPGILFSILENRELLAEKKKLQKIAEMAYGGSIADAFLAAKILADDAEDREVALGHILAHFRKDFISLEGAPLAGAIGRAKLGLRAFAALQATNVNPRLAADVMFLNFRQLISMLKDKSKITI